MERHVWSCVLLVQSWQVLSGGGGTGRGKRYSGLPSLIFSKHQHLVAGGNRNASSASHGRPEVTVWTEAGCGWGNLSWPPPAAGDPNDFWLPTATPLDSPVLVYKGRQIPKSKAHLPAHVGAAKEESEVTEAGCDSLPREDSTHPPSLRCLRPRPAMAAAGGSLEGRGLALPFLTPLPLCSQPPKGRHSSLPSHSCPGNSGVC